MVSQLLIVYHSKTGNTERLAQAVIEGARDPGVTSVEVVVREARQANDRDLMNADAVILGTPENFGYMSGALKDFFDRTFYEVEGRLRPLPYSVFISAGNDGSGALRGIRRIVGGYPLVEVQEPIVIPGEIKAEDLKRCTELGQAFAYGLDAGIF